jgi:hypothetical protein
MDDWAWEHIEPWLNSAPSCPSGRCSASSADRPAGDPARPAPLARNFGQPPRRPTYAAASPRTSCDTRTRSRWPAKASLLLVIQRQLGHTNRHHLDLPPGHRQRRDHRHRPRPPRANGPNRRLTANVTAAACRPTEQPGLDLPARPRCSLQAKGAARPAAHSRRSNHAKGKRRLRGAGPEVSVGRQRLDAPSRSWKAARYVAVGGPNQVVSASASPGWVRSPTQATYPSGRINTAMGAVTVPSAGSSHVPPYFALIN